MSLVDKVDRCNAAGNRPEDQKRLTQRFREGFERYVDGGDATARASGVTTAADTAPAIPHQ